jgi:hypothetical protein
LAPVVLAGRARLHAGTTKVIDDSHEASHLPYVPVEHAFDANFCDCKSTHRRTTAFGDVGLAPLRVMSPPAGGADG